LVGSRPADGPGSTPVVDGQIGEAPVPQKNAVNDVDTAPAETSGVKFE
jgi:hypothetical protein